MTNRHPFFGELIVFGDKTYTSNFFKWTRTAGELRGTIYYAHLTTEPLENIRQTGWRKKMNNEK